MRAVSEFAVAELARAELALDAIEYADFASAATLAGVGVASAGAVAWASASARLGERSHPDGATAYFAQARAQMAAGATAQASQTVPVMGRAVARCVGAALGASTVSARGTGTQASVGRADVEPGWFGATAAARMKCAAVVMATAKARASGAQAMRTVLDAGGVLNARAVATYAMCGRADARAGFWFTGNARLGDRDAIGRAYALATLRASAVQRQDGRALDVVLVGAQAEGRWMLDAAGRGDAVASASARAWLVQGPQAITLSVCEFQARATQALYGDTALDAIYSKLPAAQAYFTVPARMPAFVVTPEQALQEV